MIGRTFRYLKRQPTWWILALANVILAVLALLDWITGREVRIGLFYLVPTALVTLYAGRTLGFVMAVVSIIVWRFSDKAVAISAQNVSPYIDWFNIAIRTAFFLMTVVLLATWREIGAGLEHVVTERTISLSDEVAERKAAEQALHTLAMQLAEAEDIERRRLAHDIHDALGQTLSLLKFRLESAAADGQDVGATRQALADALDLIEKLIAQTRTLTFDLHPPMLDDLGLAAALRWYGKEFKRQSGVEVQINELGESRKAPMSVNTYLFRSIKELINNGLKHGRASEIFVTLHWHDSQVRAVVDDNGAGCNPMALSHATGLGLAGIRERATTLGGKLLMESEPGKGCRAILQLPLTL
jgi:signal transduction histidine kinase